MQIARHLSRNYGTMASNVLDIGKNDDLIEKLHPAHPFIKAELKWAMDYEFVEHVDDFLYRRIRLGFLDKQAVEDIKMDILDYFSKEKKWDAHRKQVELERLSQFN